MLHIDRQPLYKNRLLLSGIAVFSGFFVTVGAIQLVDPNEENDNQSAQSSEDRRATNLIPINASEEEKSSESQEKTSPKSKPKPATSPNTGTASSNTPQSGTANGEAVSPQNDTWSPRSAEQTKTEPHPSNPQAGSSGSTSSGSAPAPSSSSNESDSGNTSVLDPVPCLLPTCKP
jgi:cytoskeletal protein RodZ